MNYRFECRIYEDGDSPLKDTIVSGSTFISEVSENGSCESVDMEVGKVMRIFKKERVKMEEETKEKSKKFRFETVDEASDYYMENLASHNEDEAGRDRWLEDVSDEIRESYQENNPDGTQDRVQLDLQEEKDKENNPKN